MSKSTLLPSLSLSLSLSPLFSLSYRIDALSRRPSDLPPVPEVPDIASLPSRFEKKQEVGTIDVWWLYDDGGKCLLHYIIMT